MKLNDMDGNDSCLVDTLMKVVLIGKANVGKSTIFNSLIGKKRSVVHNRPGVTKDTIAYLLKMDYGDIEIYDTAGAIEKCEFDKYTKALINEAGIIFFVLADNIASIDKEIFTYIIKSKNKTARLVGVVNKSDRKDSNSDEFFTLSLPELIRISAEHRDNLFQIFDIIEEEFQKKHLNLSIHKDGNDRVDNDDILYEDIEVLKEVGSERRKQLAVKKHFSVAIIGTPNVGKSTFLNTILGFERVKTEDKAGTTIDSIDVKFKYKGVEITIIDTPGIRKKSNIYDEVEKKSVSSALSNIRKADVVINMFEIGTILTKQDLTLISCAVEMFKPTVLIANKYDKIESIKEKDTAKSYIESQIQNSSLRDIDVIYTTVLKRRNCFMILNRISDLYNSQYVHITTSRLNNWLNSAVSHHEHPLSTKAKKKINFKYVTQIDNNPIKLVIYTNFSDYILESYKSYLKTSFRKYFNLPMVPIKFIFKTSHNPYRG